MDHLAATVNEKTLFGRVGGAATLAAGMASIFSGVTKGRWLDLWYHFAIMFEALFILTTIDAGTRVGRYLLHDFLGAVWKPLGDTKNLGANMLASGLLVAGWGYFLIQGVRDPLGGVNSLWPLFGIANQMLAAIGLCLGTTVILKMALRAVTSDECRVTRGAPCHASRVTRHASLALITLVPLVWLLAATMTAGVQKILHPDPRIGFLAEAASLNAKLPALDDAVTAAKAGGVADAIAAAEKARIANRVLHFNNVLDAVVAAAFLVLVTGIVAISVREWVLLLARRKLAVLRETAAGVAAGLCGGRGPAAARGRGFGADAGAGQGAVRRGADGTGPAGGPAVPLLRGETWPGGERSGGGRPQGQAGTVSAGDREEA